jgi:hypothetical protein
LVKDAFHRRVAEEEVSILLGKAAPAAWQVVEAAAICRHRLVLSPVL